MTLIIAHVKKPDVLGTGAIFVFGLNIDLPLTAKAIEVVDEIPTHEGLQRAVDITERDSQFQDLVAVHLDEHLRHVRQMGCTHAGNFRTLFRGFHELVQILGKKHRVLASRTVFQHEGESAGCADARNGGR